MLVGEARPTVGGGAADCVAGDDGGAGFDADDRAHSGAHVRRHLGGGEVLPQPGFDAVRTHVGTGRQAGVGEKHHEGRRGGTRHRSPAATTVHRSLHQNIW